MEILKYISYISGHPIFKGIEPDVIAKYFSDNSLTVANYSPANIIIDPEKNSTDIYVIIKGTVEIQCCSADHKVLLKTSGPGTIFGLANLYAENETFPTLVCAKTQHWSLLH